MNLGKSLYLRLLIAYTIKREKSSEQKIIYRIGLSIEFG